VPSSVAPIRRRLRSVIALAVLAAACTPSVADAARHMGDRTLHRGDRGQDVRVLQDFLTRAGFATPIEGVFGPQTERNVKRFQRRFELDADGVVGAGTNRALRTIVARRARAQANEEAAGGGPSQHLGDRTLKKGMRGQDVRVLQDYLTRAGVATPVDGVFGPTTLRNVKRFQRAQGMTVDGVVGPGTEGTLRRIGDGGRANSTLDAPSDAPVGKARLLSNGMAVAPSDAPAAVKAVIAAGNRIATKPYRYGGGHGRWEDAGYDCSGSVSYALHGGGLLSASLNSTGFMSWGSSGRGQWITVYGNPGHAYMVVAGLRFDTSGASPSRWQSDMRSSAGYTARHPRGF
jgi:peptidoglycan hydrolase-like protein with peptidoglycan-binding domain